MVNRSELSDARRQQLSSLIDGDLAPDAVADACSLWRQDAAARAQWHAYQLIGDVLRSDDLATSPARDAAFLQALRLRLADEAVPLAPQAPAVRPRARGWLVAPMAVAAGFVAVAGVMVVTRVMAPEPGAAVLASAGAAPRVVASAVLVRDAQLDRYLSAHRRQANGAMPGDGAEHRVHIVFEGQ